MSELINVVNEGIGWPAAAVLVLAVVRELFRAVSYLLGLFLVVRDTTPGDRSTVLRAYERSRFDAAAGPVTRRRLPRS